MAAVIWPQSSVPHDGLFSEVRVFNVERRSRLTLMNACARALRGMGYRVLSEDIEPCDGGRPIIQIAPYSMKSFDMLREHAGIVSIRKYGDRQCACTDFMSIRVIWEIAA